MKDYANLDRLDPPAKVCRPSALDAAFKAWGDRIAAVLTCPVRAFEKGNKSLPDGTTQAYAKVTILSPEEFARNELARRVNGTDHSDF